VTKVPDILVAENLKKSFGSLLAIGDLSFAVRQGEILGLMGPNGAGKTTLFNLLTGVLQPDEGQIVFKGREISRASPAERCRRGMGRTYQIPRPFGKLTVFENLMVAAVHGAGLIEKEARDEVLTIVARLGLTACKDIEAGRLPLFNRRRLELGRALATRPELVLLDEIAGGLAEHEAHEVMQIVRTIQDQGTTAIMIEHILTLMTEGVDRLLVIAEGRLLACGEPGAVMRSSEVLACYLGENDA
jgi:branched-chain amino acid transport system ATP-binding protein